jgi:hypothetical protein
MADENHGKPAGIGASLQSQAACRSAGRNREKRAFGKHESSRHRLMLTTGYTKSPYRLVWLPVTAS